MKIEKIRELLHACPFRSFKMHLADVDRIRVAHEDFVALDPRGREMIVYLPDSSHRILDAMLITQLEVEAGNGASSKKKR